MLKSLGNTRSRTFKVTTMTRFSAIFLDLTLVCCLNNAVIGLSLEEKMQQLNDNYVEMREILASKDKRLDALEAEAIEQKSLLSALQLGVTPTQVVGTPRCCVQGSSTIPKSCADLKRTGQTISGLYSIMGDKSVEMVYCDFSDTTKDEGCQKWLGYVNVKSVPTYFYVQKNRSFTTLHVPIPFEVERVNIGGAMNLTSGIFTAPRAGTYFFAFTGDVRFVGPSAKILALVVELQLNDQRVGCSRVTESNTAGNVHSELTMQSTLNLIAGDQISLKITFITAGGVTFLYENANADQHYNHFTGWLLEENFAGITSKFLEN